MLDHRPPNASPDRGNFTILIADDDAGIRSLLQATLHLDGVTLIEAANGAEAIAMARAAHPDIVLLDVMMPFLDGFEVCQRLRAAPETARSHIIILTRLDRPEYQSMARTVGANEFLNKPFSPLTLLQRIYDVLESRSRQPA